MDDMKELLRETLQSDRRLLQDRQALIARLDSKVNGSMVREFASLKTALQRNVGERFLAADNASREEQKNVCAEVERQLVQEGMQEKRANGVVEALSYALGWGEKEPLEEAVFASETYEEPMPELDSMPQLESVPEVQSWVCGCGAVNMGRFCVECGRQRGAYEPQGMTTMAPPPPMAPPPGVGAPNYGPPQGMGVPNYPPPMPPQPQNNSSTKGFLYGAIGALCVGLLLFGGWKLFGDKKKTELPSLPPVETPVTPAQSAPTAPAQTKPATPKPSAPKQETNTQARPAPTSTERLSLGGIAIGYDLKKVRSLLGKEKEITDPYKSGHLRYQYPDLEVVITNGVVTGFISKNARVKTERGIHEGSSLEEVFQKYGRDYSKFNYEDSTMYEYKMKSINGKDCLQRFAIKNGKVDYVSCRVLEGQ